MPPSWLQFQQDLALAAFVAGCSIAEMQLRLLEVSIPARAVDRPRIRLVSDQFGFFVEPPGR